MYACAHSPFGDFADKIAHIDALAHRNHRQGGSADMLLQRNTYLCRLKVRLPYGSFTS